VIPPLELYSIDDTDGIVTPALLIYSDLVDANIETTLKMAGDDPNRWRPHIKTAKTPLVLGQLIAHDVRNFKCSTTLELLTACETGASDVLLAFSVMGANARRVREIAAQFPATRISVLVETGEQARTWRGSGIGIYIDVNPGMDRTGINQDRIADILGLAKELGRDFRGLHYYDGQISGVPESEREARTHAGYDHLLQIVRALEVGRVEVGEVITSGTPAAPFAMSYAGFRKAGFLHRISPGTVVYNDLSSLTQLAGFGYRPAALVLSTVISRPTSRMITCDAGHKSVSADAGVPTCEVVGHADLVPMKPSEEHLPIERRSAGDLPALGDKLYLLPRHVCPTVNNFDEALMIVNGRISGVARIAARGHENPLVAAASPIGAG
jgi:D-serine deaminase-like pyridoxal phosphate-dependent protein